MDVGPVINQTLLTVLDNEESVDIEKKILDITSRFEYFHDL